MSSLELGIPGVHTWGAISMREGRTYGRNVFGNFSEKTTLQHETKKKKLKNRVVNVTFGEKRSIPTLAGTLDQEEARLPLWSLVLVLGASFYGLG
jgi:hypothetical protein